jgi:hypothetical protein
VPEVRPQPDAAERRNSLWKARLLAGVLNEFVSALTEEAKVAADRERRRKAAERPRVGPGGSWDEARAELVASDPGLRAAMEESDHEHGMDPHCEARVREIIQLVYEQDIQYVQSTREENKALDNAVFALMEALGIPHSPECGSPRL